MREALRRGLFLVGSLVEVGVGRCLGLGSELRFNLGLGFGERNHTSPCEWCWEGSAKDV